MPLINGVEIPQKWCIPCRHCGRYLYQCNCPTPCVNVHTNRDLLSYFKYSETALDVCIHCKGCKACCHCVTCSGCRNVHQSTCTTCKQCELCCKCVKCKTCSSSVRDAKDNLCKHNNCVRCQMRYCCLRPVARFKQQVPPTFWRASKAEHKLNPTNRLLATEIEVAAVDIGCRVDDTVQQWYGGIVRDGSLPEGGFEINTAPASGDLWTTQVTAICEALANHNPQITQACGLHVHIDASDFTYYDMRRFILLYEKLEPAIFSIVPAHRRTNMYCEPCGSTYANAVRASDDMHSTKEALINAMYAADLRQWEKAMEHNYPSMRKKYQAIELAFAHEGHKGEELKQLVHEYLGHKKPAIAADWAARHIAPAEPGLYLTAPEFGAADVPTVAHPRTKKRELDIKHEKYNVEAQLARRHAVNLHSWVYANRKTFECRLHEGTVNPQDIIKWGIMWAAITDYAMACTEKQLAAMPKGKAHSFDLLMNIIPSQIYEYILQRQLQYS